MRTLIVNANIITGDGKTVLENHSLILEDELIADISNFSYRYFSNAERTIDARGGFVIPGIINHHTHGITTGPLYDGIAQVPLPLARVNENLNRHMLEGTTTVVNVDGLVNMKEVEEANSLTPINVKTCTTHTPSHLKAAKFLDLGGLSPDHMLTARQMIEEGAIGIGEAGAVIDPRQFAFFVIPNVVLQETGVHISVEEAEILRKSLAASPPDEKSANELMARRGITSAKTLRKIVQKGEEYAKLSVEASREGVQTAKELGVPYLMHNAPQTTSLILEFAEDLKNLLIACHSNFLYKPGEAIRVAREVKKQGGWIEIHTGDFFRAQIYFSNHATTLALLAEGLVDMISTDIIGFFWDPIPQILEYVINQKVIDLPKAIALATGDVPKPLPGIAPNRGIIEQGRIADIAILNASRLSSVETVIVGGQVVVSDGKLVC